MYDMLCTCSTRTKAQGQHEKVAMCVSVLHS